MGIEGLNHSRLPGHLTQGAMMTRVRSHANATILKARCSCGLQACRPAICLRHAEVAIVLPR